MIKVRVAVGDKAFEISVSGHANAAKSGEDVICAAASILVLSLQQALSKSGAADLEYTIKRGDVRISARLTRKSRHYLEAILCGFDFLANAYPQYVNMYF